MESVKLTKSCKYRELKVEVPWVPDVFSRVRRSAFRASHYKNLTETGNRARKVCHPG